MVADIFDEGIRHPVKSFRNAASYACLSVGITPKRDRQTDGRVIGMAHAIRPEFPGIEKPVIKLPSKAGMRV